MNQVRASAPPKATTRPRRALARRASGTASSTAAPAYAPGADADAERPARPDAVRDDRGVLHRRASGARRGRRSPPAGSRRRGRPAGGSGPGGSRAGGTRGRGRRAPGRHGRRSAVPAHRPRARQPRYAVVSSVHTMRPWLMCAFATCDHASAAEPQPQDPPRPSVGPPVAGRGQQHDRRPREHPRERQRDRDLGGAHHHHEREPGGGRSERRRGSPCAGTRTGPSPASSGLKTMNARIAAPGESQENSAIGGR